MFKFTLRRYSLVVEFSKEEKVDGSTGVMRTNTPDKNIVKAGSYKGGSLGSWVAQRALGANHKENVTARLIQ